MDDALNLFDLLMTEILHGASGDGKRERLRTIRDMDSAALELLTASKIIIDERYREQRIEDLFTPVFIESIRKAASTIEKLARPADDDYHNELINYYLTIRRFLPKLLESVIFNATENGQKILDAIHRR